MIFNLTSLTLLHLHKRARTHKHTRTHAHISETLYCPSNSIHKNTGTMIHVLAICRGEIEKKKMKNKRDRESRGGEDYTHGIEGLVKEVRALYPEIRKDHSRAV